MAKFVTALVAVLVIASAASVLAVQGKAQDGSAKQLRAEPPY